MGATCAVRHKAALLLHALAAHASRCAASAGEYPLASSSASERAESNKALRFRRGEMVVCTFTMQVCAAAHAALSYGVQSAYWLHIDSVLVYMVLAL